MVICMFKLVQLLTLFFGGSLLACANGGLTTKQMLPKPANKGKAPPISSLVITAVASEDHPDGEIIERNQKSTMLSHGGSYIFVTSVEIGYGTSLYATINGNKLPSSSIIQTIPLCLDSSNKPAPCRRNQKIIGFARTWDVKEKGQFTFQLSSINFPYNTESIDIFIN